MLAEGIRDAWADLFAININAHQLSKAEFIGKLKTLSQGQLSDAVMEFHYSTFSALVKNADFTSHPPKPLKTGEKDEKDGKDQIKKDERKDDGKKSELQLGGLVYNIQIVLPESRDPAVYDALFKSLKDHLV